MPKIAVGMNENYTLLELTVVKGKLSLLNSWVKHIDNTNLRLMKKYIDDKIDNQLSTDFGMRETNTYKEVLNSNSSIEWEYYRYIVNEDDAGFCIGIIK